MRAGEGAREGLGMSDVCVCSPVLIHAGDLISSCRPFSSSFFEVGNMTNAPKKENDDDTRFQRSKLSSRLLRPYLECGSRSVTVLVQRIYSNQPEILFSF